MKFTLPILAAALVLTFSSSQAQDTATRKKQPPQPAPGRTAATGETKDTNPIINKIAVNDPGMPPERPASTTKGTTTPKPKEKRKRGNSGVTPK